jgi:hypothetical protein
MKQTAVEWLSEHLCNEMNFDYWKAVEQAKEIEKQQFFKAKNISAKEAYKAGQKTMNCGCYEISDATTYEEWLYEQFKSEQ